MPTAKCPNVLPPSDRAGLPEVMGLREYARHRARLGLPGATHVAVRDAIRSGRLVASLTADRKKVRSAKAADVEWAASTKEDRVPLSGPTAPAAAPPAVPGASEAAAAPPVNELALARARREAAGADLAEIELAEKRGELVRARDIEARLADVFLRCRTRIMGVAARLREQDPTFSGTQLQLVEELLREALEELAGGAAA